jgi:uncharacterized membrane protein YfcA
VPEGKCVPEILLVVLAVGVGALARGFLGFGDAVVAMPLLALVGVGLELAVPVVGLGGLTIALLTVRRDMDVDRTVLWRLLLATLVGLPVGVLLVTRAPERLLTGTLGALLAVYGVVMLARGRVARQLGAGWAVPFGLAAGGLGGAFNLNGVPVAVFGTLRGWDPARFRGTLQAYFGISSLLVAVGHGLGGLWSWQVAGAYGVAVPGIVLGVMLGRRLQRHASPQVFLRLVFAVIACLGLLLLLP